MRCLSHTTLVVGYAVWGTWAAPWTLWHVCGGLLCSGTGMPRSVCGCLGSKPPMGLCL